MRWILASLLFAAAPAAAEPRDWIEENKTELLREYIALLEIPNVASNLTDIRRNADFIMARMEERGLSPRLLETEGGDAPPLIYGEWLVPGAEKTYVFYAHYDGQPVTPEDWTVTPPFEPKLVGEGEDARIYARSTSDDKAGVFAILAAVEVLKAEGAAPAFNLKIVFEGEEEAGSPHLGHLLRRHRDTLRSDGWVIIDGPAHQSGAPQLSLGVRGDVNMHVTVYGPARPLHSGHYGNWAPNPAMMLAELLASMKDENGRVTIAGFYDDVVPLTTAEWEAIAAVPAPDEALRRELGLGWTEGGGATLTESVQLPSLNINGMRSADVGENARNVIPTTATAAIDLRLVLGNSPDRQVDRVIEHIRTQGYHVLDREPTLEERRHYPKIARVNHTRGYPAQRVALHDPLPQALVPVLRAHGDIMVFPSLGGSLPLYLIKEELGVSNVALSLWNHDNNQHAEDENIRLGHLWDGIATVAALMKME